MNRSDDTDDVARRIGQLEQQLAGARRAAGVAHDAKMAFLGNVHHELRTPLNAVLGMLDLLLDSRLDDEQRLHAATAKDSASALLRLVNDILDLSRLDGGDLPLEPTVFDLRALLNEVRAILGPKARARGLDLVTHISGDISPRFNADCGRIGQILNHLVENAIKFTNDGQVVLTIRSLSAEERREQVRMSVSDTGIGIPPERQRDIFDMFTQTDSSSTRGQGGLGFGLTLVHRLTERMGGSLGVESQVGEGSTFWIDLWLSKELPHAGARGFLQEADDLLATGQADAGGAKPFHGTRVLLVDDNPVNRKVAQRLLEKQGCETCIATNGLEAVQAALDDDFDLILMDVQMPVMDGLEATREIRAREIGTGSRTPIVALTANVLAEDRARCFEAGMEEFLAKPVGPKVLAATLSRFGRCAAVQDRD